jgi:hypothetical protein
MAMTRPYTLAGAEAFSHVPAHPDRTTKRRATSAPTVCPSSGTDPPDPTRTGGVFRLTCPACRRAWLAVKRHALPVMIPAHWPEWPGETR